MNGFCGYFTELKIPWQHKEEVDGAHEEVYPKDPEKAPAKWEFAVVPAKSEEQVRDGIEALSGS